VIEVDAAALRAAREKKAMSRARLAHRSGVSERALREREMRGGRMRESNLESIAKVLDVDPGSLVKRRDAPASVTDARAANGASNAKKPLRERTHMERLVTLEGAARGRARVRTPRGELPLVTARVTQDLYTAYATYEGEVFVVRGVLDTHRGLSVPEGKLLGTRSGVGACFLVVCEIADGEQLGVTVHTRLREQTRRLQALRDEKVTLVVRVVCVPGEPVDGGPGFSSFMRQRPGPWALVVEEILD
jgi:transcriptional regulator with XRE-family HTH domain